MVNIPDKGLLRKDQKYNSAKAIDLFQLLCDLLNNLKEPLLSDLINKLPEMIITKMKELDN